MNYQKYLKYKNKYMDYKIKNNVISQSDIQIGGDTINISTNERTFISHDNMSNPYKYTINYKTGEIKVFDLIKDASDENFEDKKDEYNKIPILHLNKSSYIRFYVGHNYGKEAWYCGGTKYNYG